MLINWQLHFIKRGWKPLPAHLCTRLVLVQCASSTSSRAEPPCDTGRANKMPPCAAELSTQRAHPLSPVTAVTTGCHSSCCTGMSEATHKGNVQVPVFDKVTGVSKWFWHYYWPQQMWASLTQSWAWSGMTPASQMNHATSNSTLSYISCCIFAWSQVTLRRHRMDSAPTDYPWFCYSFLLVCNK